MATFKQIIDKSPVSNSPMWVLGEMFSAINTRLLDCRDYQQDLAEDVVEIMGGDFVVKVVLDFEFNSDEVCEITVACFDGEPVLIHKKVGDKLSYDDGVEILNVDFAKRLVQALLQVKANKILKDLSSQAAESEGFLKQNGFLLKDMNYVSPLTNSIFSIPHPKWLISTRTFVDYPAYVITSDGKPLRIKNFIGWASEFSSWSKDKNANRCTLEMQDGQEIEADARNILFALADDVDEFQSIIKQIQDPDVWVMLKEPSEGSVLRIVNQHIKGQVFFNHHTVLFDNPIDAQKAESQFASPNLGVFSRHCDEMKDFQECIDWSII